MDIEIKSPVFYWCCHIGATYPRWQAGFVFKQYPGIDRGFDRRRNICLWMLLVPVQNRSRNDCALRVIDAAECLNFRSTRTLKRKLPILGAGFVPGSADVDRPFSRLSKICFLQQGDLGSLSP
jgi:hypothetical protein